MSKRHYILTDVFHQPEVEEGGTEKPPELLFKRGDAVYVDGGGTLCWLKGEQVAPEGFFLLVPDAGNGVLIPSWAATEQDANSEKDYLVHEPPAVLNPGDKITLRCVSHDDQPDLVVFWESILRDEELRGAKEFQEYLTGHCGGLVWIDKRDSMLHASLSITW